jgi:hypothetical protein
MRFYQSRFDRETGWDREPDRALDGAHTLLLAFADAREPAVAQALDELAERFPHSVLLGCSSAGEIHGREVTDGSLSLAVLCFEQTRLRAVSVPMQSREESLFVGRDLATRLYAPDLSGVLVLSDGLNVNGSLLVDGIGSLLGDGVVVTGGLAGDGGRFEKTWVWTRAGRQPGHVAGLGLYGSRVRMAHGSRGGWEQMDSELEITHAIGNVVYELNDRPALEVYRERLGEDAHGLPASGLLHPLAIPNPLAPEGATVRTVLAVDEDEQSIVFAGDLPDTGKVHLMRTDLDSLVAGAAEASFEALERGEADQAVVCVAISCVGRRLVLKDRTDEELAATLAALPTGSGQLGFYSYGEISPLASGRCNLHNQTMTLTLIGEV